MADSKINDYLGEYFFRESKLVGPPVLEAHHFTLDEIAALQRIGATFTKISSIKDPPYKPIDVTEKTLAALERMK